MVWLTIDIFVFPTLHGTADTEVHRQGDVEPVPKPVIIHQWNQLMGSVNSYDQMLKTYCQGVQENEGVQ